MPIVTRSRDLVELGLIHGTGVKGGYLVIVEIGGDERLRREDIIEHSNLILADAPAVEPVRIRREVLAHGRHRQRIPAEQLQIVGDVRRAAAELPAKLGHEKRDVQDMYLVRQDVILERILEHHDVVIGY